MNTRAFREHSIILFQSMGEENRHDGVLPLNKLGCTVNKYNNLASAKLLLLNENKINKLKESAEKRYIYKHARSPVLEDANCDLESEDLRNVLRHHRLKLSDFSLNCIFHCYVRSRLSIYQVCFLKCTVNR